MAIYTGYYASAHLYNGILIGVSRWQPAWYKGYTLKALAPNADLLKRRHKITRERFIQEFNWQLESLEEEQLEKIYNYLSNLEYYDDLYLLCFEKPTEFCHRHYLAQWLNKQFGWNVTEKLIEETDIEGDY